MKIEADTKVTEQRGFGEFDLCAPIIRLDDEEWTLPENYAAESEARSRAEEIVDNIEAHARLALSLAGWRTPL